MTSHPNFDRAQAILDASRRGDYAPAFDNFADDIVMENGPGAGPWHRARGQDDLALMLLELAGSFGDAFRQDDRCVYGDDRVSISLIHVTGTAPGGDQFDNLAVYIGRLRPDGCGTSTSTPSTAKRLRLRYRAESWCLESETVVQKLATLAWNGRCGGAGEFQDHARFLKGESSVTARMTDAPPDW
jgi:ketosteroid isomerase-like protein